MPIAKIGGLAGAALLVAAASAWVTPLEARRRLEPSPAASRVDPAARRPFTVAVLGGATALALADALRATPDTVIVTAVLDGLADPGRPERIDQVRALLERQPVDAALILPGESDGKPLQDGATLIEPGAPAWRTRYAARIGALAQLFTRRHVPLVWVGLPVAADEDGAAAAAALNEAARSSTAAAGAVYADSWNAFADENGGFVENGPDAEGHVVPLRTPDGRGFTPAGAAKLAGVVAGDLRRARAEAEAAAVASVVLPGQPEIDADLNAQIRGELGLAPTVTSAAATPPPSIEPVTAAPPEMVTAPPTSADGQLIAADIGPTPLDGTAQSLAQRVLVEGRPIAPKPGRIDDFSWPRP